MDRKFDGRSTEKNRFGAGSTEKIIRKIIRKNYGKKNDWHKPTEKIFGKITEEK